MHPLLVNAGASIGFGALAAAAGMLGSFALSKANIKSKYANVGANVGAALLVGGAVGMADRAAGTVVAHNYLVAAGQWLGAPGDSDAPTTAHAQLPAGTGASPDALSKAQKAAATHGLYDEPDPESITRALPPPGMGSPIDNLGAYRGVSGLGSPLDHLGSPLDHLGNYSHLNGIMADDVGGPDDVDGFQHLNGILADNLGDEMEGFGDDIEAVLADDVGEEDFGDEID